MPPPPPLVVDVWADNQDAELARIHGLVRDFQIAAVATSHDVPAGPLPASSRSPPPHNRTLESCYEAVRSRVDRVRFAQLCLALVNRKGELGGRVWRFHLADTDAGDERFLACIGAEPARRRRADPRRVCRALRESSRAIMPGGIWVTSDGAEDVAYLVRHICGGRLPYRRDEFMRVCATSFPALYDLKVLAEWMTVGENEPPLVGAGGSTPLFTRFLALAREQNFASRMLGYTGFLYGLGAVDNYELVYFKRVKAEFEEKDRRMMALFAQVCGEGCLERMVLW